MHHHFISSRHVAQAAAALNRPETDTAHAREVLLSGGMVRGSIEHVQAIARREAACCEA